MTYVDCPRLPRPVEMSVREGKLHPYEPETRAEHDELVKGLGAMTLVDRSLTALKKALDKLPETWRRELNTPDVFLLDISDADIEAVRKQADDMEAALDNSEFGS